MKGVGGQRLPGTICDKRKRFSLGPPGAVQDGLRHVFRPRGAQWLRRVLQPHERSHQLRHIGVQELRGDERGPTGPGRAGGAAGHADAAGANAQVQTVIDA